MIESSIWRPSAVRVAERATGAGNGDGRPWRARLRAILNAQTLIRGVGGGPGDVAFIEDDHQRLARRGN
jgi:hypothetical protein